MSQQLLRDPFYGQLIASIGVTTALADRKAEEDAQIKFTDSQVKAVFHRVIKTLEGKPPKAKESKSEKERQQANLFGELIALRPTIIVTNRETQEKGPLPVSMYLKAMKAAKLTLEQRRSGEPGARGYLDQAHAMLDQVEAEDDTDTESDSEPSSKSAED